MENLYNDYKKVYEGEEIVLGDGSLDAKIVFIGEAPGKDEVEKGKPFVGMAGQNLMKSFETVNIKREDVFITNAIKYRLFEINAKTGRKRNRPAKANEINENRKYLIEEINIIKPNIIVTLGNVPLRSITGNAKNTIGNCHGKKMDIEIMKKKYILFPLYHPASLIYNRDLIKVYDKDLNNLIEFSKEIKQR